MGKSFTPKYRIEFHSNTNMTAAAWKGQATTARLEAHVRHLNESFRPGGVNAHVGDGLGFIPYISRARIVRQSDDSMISDWTAPAFEVF